ncbi:MAG: hypothetical protein PUA59_05090 [Clostridium sp.]|nr:hypothetical protein [Clostridium sp.]
MKCEKGKLIITVDRERVQVEQEEHAIIEEEMMKLKKGFEIEKK